MHKYFILIMLLVLTTGCAGTKFSRIQNDQLNLGVETIGEIRNQLGNPYQESTLLKNEKTMQELTYGYATSTVSSVFGTKPVSNHAQTFYFYKGILVGHNYTSTRQEDMTDFDESKVEKIKKGVTKISEVRELLGPPSGEYIYPMIDNKDDKGYVYFYVQVRSGAFKLNIYQEVLTISYNADGIVTKVDFVATGNK